MTCVVVGGRRTGMSHVFIASDFSIGLKVGSEVMDIAWSPVNVEIKEDTRPYYRKYEKRARHRK